MVFWRFTLKMRGFALQCQIEVTWQLWASLAFSLVGVALAVVEIVLIPRGFSIIVEVASYLTLLISVTAFVIFTYLHVDYCVLTRIAKKMRGTWNASSSYSWQFECMRFNTSGLQPPALQPAEPQVPPQARTCRAVFLRVDENEHRCYLEFQPGVDPIDLSLQRRTEQTTELRISLPISQSIQIENSQEDGTAASSPGGTPA